MDFELFKEELFKEAKNSGFEEFEIYYSDAESLSLSIYEGEVEKYKLNNALVFRSEEKSITKWDIHILKY